VASGCRKTAGWLRARRNATANCPSSTTTTLAARFGVGRRRACVTSPTYLIRRAVCGLHLPSGQRRETRGAPDAAPNCVQSCRLRSLAWTAGLSGGRRLASGLAACCCCRRCWSAGCVLAVLAVPLGRNLGVVLRCRWSAGSISAGRPVCLAGWLAGRLLSDSVAIPQASCLLVSMADDLLYISVCACVCVLRAGLLSVSWWLLSSNAARLEGIACSPPLASLESPPS
jgi:hypothetical protein